MRQTLLALCLMLPMAAAAQSVVQPRAHGYLIGDTFEQRVRVGADVALPPLRLNLFLERQSARSEHDALGQRWLVVRYQIINAPTTRQRVELPGWRAGAVTVPALWIDVGPLVPDDTRAPQLEPPRPVPLPDAASPARRARLAALFTAFAALGWLGCALRERQRAAQRPFARAWRALRVEASASEDAQYHALHAALNSAAGYSVQAEDLARLLGQLPWLAAQRAELARFFEASSARFFQRAGEPASLDLPRLARQLCAAERRGVA